MRYQVTHTFHGVHFKKFPEQLGREICHRCNLLQIDRDMLTPRLLYGFFHYTALAEATGADEYQVVGAVNELADIFHLIHPICEVFFLHDGAEFKRILHITTFFVVGCKDNILFSNIKRNANKILQSDITHFHFP